MTHDLDNSRPDDQPDNPLFWALIPCAGSGSRAGTQGPKQYQLLAGRPLVLHTLAAFAGVARIARTAVVVATDDKFFESGNAGGAQTAAAPADRSGGATLATYLIAACGGATRATSVLNGLKFLLQHGARGSDWVLVHDAARCLITPAQINAVIDACASDPVGGLLAHKLADTLKSEVQGRVAASLERSDKWLAQTPQMFRIGALMDALKLAGDQVTDESSAMEAAGLHPLLVPGSAQNFKVTYPEDFALAQAVLAARAAQDGKREASAA